MKFIKTFEFFSNQVSAAGVSYDGGDSTANSAADTRKNKKTDDITPSNQKIVSKKPPKRLKKTLDSKPIEYQTPIFKTGDSFYLGI